MYLIQGGGWYFEREIGAKQMMHSHRDGRCLSVLIFITSFLMGLRGKPLYEERAGKYEFLIEMK